MAERRKFFSFMNHFREVQYAFLQDVFWLPDLYDAQCTILPGFPVDWHHMTINFTTFSGYSSASAADFHRLPFPVEPTSIFHYINILLYSEIKMPLLST
jgi:hypothetical protein